METITLVYPIEDEGGQISQLELRRATVADLEIMERESGGRAEAQAAHIMPVASNGPDSIRNGLTLSGTVHWMFDRGLLSLSKYYRLL